MTNAINLEVLAEQIRKTGASVGVGLNYFVPTLNVQFFTKRQWSDSLGIVIDYLTKLTQIDRNFTVQNFDLNSQRWIFIKDEDTVLRLNVILAYNGYKGMYEN
jgi:hypothetical protein